MSVEKWLHVVVQDDSGGRVAGVRVAIERAPGPLPERIAVSDRCGEAKLAIRTIGQYEIVCSATGYEAVSISAMITDDAVSVVTVTLRPSQ